MSLNLVRRNSDLTSDKQSINQYIYHLAPRFRTLNVCEINHTFLEISNDYNATYFRKNPWRHSL